jgi:hypothetical protein
MHSCFIENHPIRILEDGPLISEVVLSYRGMKSIKASNDSASPSQLLDTKEEEQ